LRGHFEVQEREEIEGTEGRERKKKEGKGQNEGKSPSTQK